MKIKTNKTKMKTKTKTKTKFLTGFSILSIVFIVILSGCISEKEQKNNCNSPYIQVSDRCCLDQDNNSICDEDEKLTEEKEVPEEELPVVIESPGELDETKNETPKVNEIDSVKSWCLTWVGRGDAVVRGGEAVAKNNDVKKHNDRFMCHNWYSLGTEGRVDVYWTKNEEEVYKVTTYSDGTIEEIKFINGTEIKGTDELKEEFAACDGIADFNKRDACYTNLAVSKGDVSICNKIIMRGKDDCVKAVAISDENMLICNRINAGDIKDACFKEIAELKKDSGICDKIRNMGEKDACYNNVAFAKQEHAICIKIESNSMKDDCYGRIATSKQDQAICSSIKTDSKRDDCYMKIAAAKKDSLICYKIAGDSGKDDCYKAVAVSKQDYSICDKIQGTSKEYECYTEIAVLKKDPTICDKIENPAKRNTCYKSI